MTDGHFVLLKESIDGRKITFFSYINLRLSYVKRFGIYFHFWVDILRVGPPHLIYKSLHDTYSTSTVIFVENSKG